MAVWRADPRNAAILIDLRAFAQGAQLAGCLRLAELFAPGHPEAREFADRFVKAQVEGLDTASLGQIALRHATDGAHTTLVLARRGKATLSLSATTGDGEAAAAAGSIVFQPLDCWEHVLAGSASAELIDRPDEQAPAALRRRSIVLARGSVIARDASRQALLIKRREGVLVTLRLQRRQPGGGPAREYDLASGKLLRQAANNARDSRRELAMAVLGRMGRADTAPVMARIARDSGCDALRWQALRECLALDTAIGFEALSRIATDPRDALARPADALRAQLIAAHPQLAELLECPA